MKPKTIYDQQRFFEKYAQMERSKKGLEGAGEWTAFRGLLPPLRDKDILDLGCGYGHHIAYFLEKQAASVMAIDASERMLSVARQRMEDARVRFEHVAIEDYDYPIHRYDLVFSSLALHYVADYEALLKGVFRTLRSGGEFVFSVEHPVFTAQGTQQWAERDGHRLHWPVDRYFEEGARESIFLGESVPKVHRTLQTYLNTLLQEGFALVRVIEPTPPPAWLEQPDMADELRRPMMLCIKARKDTHEIPYRRERA